MVPIPRWAGLLPLVPLTIVVALWEYYGRVHGGVYSFPAFSLVLKALGNVLTNPALYAAAANSLQILVWGFALALAVGIPLGLAMGRLPGLERLLQGYVTILLSTPMSALIPVVIIALGIGRISQVLVVFCFAVVVIMVNTTAGVRTVDRSLIDMARSFGATGTRLFRYIILPGALPSVMAGVRLGAGRAVVGMVVSELIIISRGLGGLLNEYGHQFKQDHMMAMVLVLLSIGVTVLSMVRWVEARTGVWREGVSRR